MSLNYQVTMSYPDSAEKFIKNLSAILGEAFRPISNGLQSSDFSISVTKTIDGLEHKLNSYKLDLDLDIEITVLIPLDENWEIPTAELLKNILSFENYMVVEVNYEAPFIKKIKGRYFVDTTKTIIPIDRLGIVKFTEEDMPID